MMTARVMQVEVYPAERQPGDVVISLVDTGRGEIRVAVERECRTAGGSIDSAPGGDEVPGSPYARITIVPPGGLTHGNSHG